MKIKTLFLFLSFCFIFFCSGLLSYYSFYSLWICVLIKLELEFQDEIGGKSRLVLPVFCPWCCLLTQYPRQPVGGACVWQKEDRNRC